eukprot:TRINITY_DN10841_c0_g1_i3.p1 TRINITY_DN10841_c0_g1~~TRINITY_DN10841_c0_g1_i3.p1  ORF type:complete len:337 (-),score=68.92 TRINITY_DN10841_c0_g1_i3:120-1130(-)
MKRTPSGVSAKRVVTVLEKDKPQSHRFLSPQPKREFERPKSKTPNRGRTLVSLERLPSGGSQKHISMERSPRMLGTNLTTMVPIEEARFDEMEHRYREEIEELTSAICNGFRQRLSPREHLKSMMAFEAARGRHEKIRTELQIVHESTKETERANDDLLKEIIALEEELLTLRKEKELESLKEENRSLRLAIADASRQLGEVAANEQALEREVAELTRANRILREVVDDMGASLLGLEQNVHEIELNLLEKDSAAEEFRALIAERADLQRQLKSAESALQSTKTRTPKRSTSNSFASDAQDIIHLREVLTELEKKAELLMKDNRSLNNLLLTRIGV